MKSRGVTLVVVLLVWALGAAVLRTWPEAGARGAVKPEQARALGGAGGVLSLMGGMRSAVANGCWLRVNDAWERRDEAGTVAWLNLTVAADERPVYFWLNGARMLAYDLPEWRRDPAVPAAVQAGLDETHTQQALGFLEKGLRWHGPDPALYVELANIHWRRRGDLDQAAYYYRLAAEQPAAPAYAARIYGELLRVLGQPQEALLWLRQLAPRLDASNPLDRREVVLARIAELELELERTLPGGGGGVISPAAVGDGPSQNSRD